MADIAIIHPGQMGSSVAAAARSVGNDVSWLAAGRSQATVDRAAAIDLRDAGTLERLCESEMVVSVCPPAFAVAVATEVAGAGFGGLYVDANAVSPSTAAQVAAVVRAAGATPIDGGIVGPPAWSAGTTRLYLAGDGAEAVVEAFRGGLLDVIALDTDYGSASALKMAYAGWTKGSSALLMSIAAFAEAAGVSEALHNEWNISLPGVATRAENSARGTAPKAWRFVGEMHEIAASLREAGLPDGFHLAAADAYQRLASFKDPEHAPDLESVVEALLKGVD
jgi:3-hydroxyisobutyrate dehydrogenase-like beta-hydroxyacid dehydrogenase